MWRSIVIGGVWLGLSLPWPSPGWSQSGDHDHEPGVDASASSTDGTVGGIPVSFLERPLPIRADVGSIRDPVTTAVPAAQAHYDQGLAYLYGYHYVNASRSFRSALRHDPDLALAYIGLSRAYARLGDRDAAEAALAEAEARAAVVSERERLRISLRRQAMEVGGDDAAREAYLEALDTAVELHPDDVELVMLRALNTRGEERVARLEAVLSLAPEHSGAHHELIHAYEGLGDTESAVRHGSELARLAPGIPHGRHMYGHNLMRVGRVPEAVREFTAADLLEREYLVRENVPPAYDWHHPHNLHLLALTHWHQGRTDLAAGLLRVRAEIRNLTGEVRPHLRVPLIELLLSTGKTESAEEALETARTLTADGATGSTAIRGHVLTADALLALGQVDEAAEAMSRAEASGEARGGRQLQNQLRRVREQIRLHGPERDEAAASLRALAPEMRRDGGPDGWIASLMQLDAAARGARDAGDHELARFFAEQMIDHDPTLAAGFHHLGLALRELGQPGPAAEAFHPQSYAAPVSCWMLVLPRTRTEEERMVVRTWRGATRAEDADDYLEYLRRTGLAEYRRVPGNVGVIALRGVENERAKFLLISFWESEASIHEFAGDTLDRAVFYPEDGRYLIDRDERVEHFEVVFQEGCSSKTEP